MHAIMSPNSRCVHAGLTGFIISFNPTVEGWNIDVDNWFWKLIRWTTYQSPIARTKGYDWYVNMFYVHIAIIMTLVTAVAALTLALRKAEQSKRLQKMARWLQFFTDVTFSMFYVGLSTCCMWLAWRLLHQTLLAASDTTQAELVAATQ
jgi:hypothetical protein